MSERRTFNASQRSGLWLASGGACEMCGVELEPGWHADHVTPYSANGATDVTNGAALCASCNIKKGARMTDPRTIWQQSAVDKFLKSGHDFLVTACPGAGKTRMALSAAVALRDRGEIERVIVVVPTDQLRQQWSMEAVAFHLDLTANHRNDSGALPSDVDGAVVTYQQLPYAASYWRKLTSTKPTLVIFDEIHHAAEHEDAHWGRALKEAFEVAVRRLLLSGTPFRTDGAPIPFVRYDDNGMSKSDAGLAYGEGVAKSIVRPLRFEVLDGRAEWVDGATHVATELRTMSDSDKASALATVYEPSGDWIRSVFEKADAELSRMREEMPDAGGLILAPLAKSHAKEYAAIMSNICGEPVDAVYADMKDGQPSKVIRRFANGSARWLVAVDMVSEGVDIPRLAVGVYASRKTTEMWFRQVAGRFTRIRGEDDVLTGTILIPAVEKLVDIARRIEGEADAALKEAEDRARRQAEREERQVQISFIEPLRSSEAVLSEAVVSGSVVTDAELRQASAIQASVGGSLAKAHLADLARALRLVGSRPEPSVVANIPPSTATGDQYRKSLRKQLAKAASRHCMRTNQPHSHVNRELNEVMGVAKRDEASVAQLQKGIEAIEAWSVRW